MKDALEEMSETPADKLSRVDKIWARDVKELSYDIEDSIDTFIVRSRYEKTSELVGIDEARDELIKMMVMGGSQASKQQEKVVSIVGFGGLGKTTLANVVYENLRGQFDCSAFVAVSQTPNMEILFNNLLYQLDKRNNAGINNVIDDLREFLHGKRYFIVIDDIWDISVWKIIRYALPDHNRGCKIITTTRIMNVAEEIGCAYKMKPLCLHSSKILFYRRIFGNKDKCPDEELAIVSDRILIKCAGVPLAIITIASLLASKGRNKLLGESIRSMGQLPLEEA
ncbi:disease resistance protein RGA5-like [Miscanthus floridulus]|uniref:disease resistance protein RGA5-like n=1 Tax=Miscanthus floridulus TaxID=154761 RepID=UPI00345B11CD